MHGAKKTMITCTLGSTVLICAMTTFLPTIDFPPSVQMSTEWKRQIISWYYYENYFVCMVILQDLEPFRGP